MYGIVLCKVCRRPRIADKSRSKSSCPYCNNTENTKDMIFHLESTDQSIIRSKLQEMTSFFDVDIKNKKECTSKPDPYSTMIFKFEHCSDPYEKMCILANGLTHIQGTFTLDDIKKIVGDNAEKVILSMLSQCIVFEVETGIYKA